MPAWYRKKIKDCRRKENFSKGKLMLYLSLLVSLVFLKRLQILVISKGLFVMIRFSVFL